MDIESRLPVYVSFVKMHCISLKAYFASFFTANRMQEISLLICEKIQKSQVMHIDQYCLKLGRDWLQIPDRMSRCLMFCL